jgi:hypothetical protein
MNLNKILAKLIKLNQLGNQLTNGGAASRRLKPTMSSTSPINDKLQKYSNKSKLKLILFGIGSLASSGYLLREKLSTSNSLKEPENSTDSTRRTFVDEHFFNFQKPMGIFLRPFFFNSNYLTLKAKEPEVKAKVSCEIFVRGVSCRFLKSFSNQMSLE